MVRGLEETLRDNGSFCAGVGGRSDTLPPPYPPQPQPTPSCRAAVPDALRTRAHPPARCPSESVDGRRQTSRLLLPLLTRILNVTTDQRFTFNIWEMLVALGFDVETANFAVRALAPRVDKAMTRARQVFPGLDALIERDLSRLPPPQSM